MCPAQRGRLGSAFHRWMVYEIARYTDACVYDFKFSLAVYKVSKHGVSGEHPEQTRAHLKQHQGLDPLENLNKILQPTVKCKSLVWSHLQDVNISGEQLKCI